MTKYRDALPQLGGGLFLSDGGIETSLIYNEGLELPHFAAFHLLKTARGTDALRRYFRGYAMIARRRGMGLVLESATWRSSPDWGTLLGYDAAALAAANREALALLEEVRAEHEAPGTPIVVSGCLGPRGDGYAPGAVMTAAEAEAYHRPQVELFAAAGADMASAITMNYAAEAEGIARAARKAGLPSAISFTVETDGRLPTGQTLRAAVEQVDRATEGAPAYYMVNCAHPDHLEGALREGGDWLERLKGLRANASRKSHAELNEATSLDAGDPAEFGRLHASLRKRLPALAVLGGCCGTDERHIDAIAAACG